MGKINLTAKNGNEGILLSYLNEFASEALAERINNGTKTLTQCFNYIISQAKELAENGCACVPDDTVYGWAIHFFEEDDIKGEDYNKKSAAAVVKSENSKTEEKAVKEAEKPKKIKKASAESARFEQFDIFGGL